LGAGIVGDLIEQGGFPDACRSNEGHRAATILRGVVEEFLGLFSFMPSPDHALTLTMGGWISQESLDPFLEQFGLGTNLEESGLGTILNSLVSLQKMQQF
jgi:hypothetical protein